MERFHQFERESLIIGPSNSGKTSLVAALQLSSSNDLVTRKRYGVSIIPRNKAMQEVSDQAWKAIQYGRLPIGATTIPTEYVFEYSRKSRGLFAKLFMGGKQSNLFRVTDGPGGDIITGETVDLNQHNTNHQKLIAKAKKCHSLVLCIDSIDYDRSPEFIKGIPKFFYDLGEHQFSSVIILLTKADSYFHQYGRLALRKAQRSDPWPTLYKILTPAGLGAILTYCNREDTELIAGWCSAYGFIPKTGEANFNFENDCMATYDGNLWSIPKVSRSWRPFAVTDFLTYLAVRELGMLWAFDWKHLDRRME